MQFPGQAPSGIGVVFDCGMGNRVDEALAMALLYGLDGKNEARVIALSVSKPNLKAAAFCDAISRFYAGAPSGAFGAVGRTLPVGLADSGKLSADTPMISVPLAKRNSEGKPLYNHGIEKLSDTAEVRALLRNALAQQTDQSCVVILTGPATNLARLLELPGTKEIVKSKVKLLALAGGAYPNGAPQFNISADVAAAKKLFAEWPTPIIAAGEELGVSLAYPAASIEKDFAWTPAHPVVDAYQAYQTMPYDAPTTAMAAVLQAIRPQENYFKLSEPGTITVQDDGRTKFMPAPEGKHRYLLLDAAQQERTLKTYIELASAKPVPKQPRMRRPPPPPVEAPKTTAPKNPGQ